MTDEIFVRVSSLNPPENISKWTENDAIGVLREAIMTSLECQDMRSGEVVFVYVTPRVRGAIAMYRTQQEAAAMLPTTNTKARERVLAPIGPRQIRSVLMAGRRVLVATFSQIDRKDLS